MFTSGGFNGSDFLEAENDRGRGLARYRSAPSSFLAALLDSNASDNSSSGDDDQSDVFFSALIDDDVPRRQYPNQESGTPVHCSAKQEIGPAETPEPHTGYVGSYPVGTESQVLVGQSSSPAMFFNGFGVMGLGEANHHTSSSRFMPTIPENVNESQIATSIPENGRLKRSRDGDQKMFPEFNGFGNQDGRSKKIATGLVSHMSLPKTRAEMAVVDNYLNFEQETNGVPCQLRAKRGFATHPRSIAERMRRTRISDKMKKLQDLFPNMDKQTKTADMLDMAVDYIKDLQNQLQTLTDTNTKCVCVNK